MNPTTWDTEYFGGIDNSIWTWSGIKCPSSTRLSLWPASLRNTSPRWVLNWPYSTFRRHFGMNTMWYLHSHVVWLKLSNLSIVVSSPLVCLAAHEGSFHDGHSLKCQTSTATPAEPGELPLGLAEQEAALCLRRGVSTKPSREPLCRPAAPRSSGSGTRSPSRGTNPGPRSRSAG